MQFELDYTTSDRLLKTSAHFRGVVLDLLSDKERAVKDLRESYARISTQNQALSDENRKHRAEIERLQGLIRTQPKEVETYGLDIEETKLALDAYKKEVSKAMFGQGENKIANIKAIRQAIYDYRDSIGRTERFGLAQAKGFVENDDFRKMVGLRPLLG